MTSEFLKVEILTPVHIGSGEQVDPFNYVIQQEGETNLCHFIDPGAWAGDYPDPEELARIFAGGSVASMRQFMADNIDAAAYARRSCLVIGDNLIAEYQKHLNQPDSPNQMLLAPNLIGGGGGPLLPGSSIKGAIRTAVIDWLDREKKLQLKRCSRVNEINKALEQYLGRITDNSFQALKIADCEAVSGSSLLVNAVEAKRTPKPNAKPRPNPPCEAMSSRLLGDAQAAVLATRIVLGRAGERGGRLTLKDGNKLDWNDLAQLVNSYSKQRYQAEADKFWRQPHFARTRKALSAIEPLILQPPPGSMVFKVGHYSQVEYVTVKNNKPLTRRGHDGSNIPYGTTRTLADGVYPFGWLMLTPCSEQEYTDIVTRRQEVNRKLSSQKEQLRQSRRQQLAQQREQVLQQRKQARQQRLRKEQQQRDEAANPWKKVLRTIDTITTWGDFKQQILERQELVEYKQVEEFADAVYQCAKKIRAKAKVGKWGEERDQALVKWFEGSARQWSLAEKDTGQPQQVSPQAQQQMERINGLNDWGAYKAAGLILDDLELVALQCLREKLKLWKCDNKKSKNRDKYTTWQKVQKQIRSTKQ